MENKTLKNGTLVINYGIEDDYDIAGEILEENEYTANISVYDAYIDRIENNFENTYSVKVERETDFENLLREMRREKRHFRDDKEQKERKIISFYHKGLFTIEETRKAIDINNERVCDCRLCNFELTFPEWKSGKMSNGKRVGKALGKAGYSKDILDYYSQQIKTEKDIFLTITSKVQYIAGMTYFADRNIWDSCQNTKSGDGEYAIRLGGSLHDSKLFIAFLHESLDDLKDMEDRMMARSIMRYMTVDCKPCLIATTYYGNNETRNMLDYALGQLEEMDIYGNAMRHGETVELSQNVDGYYNMVVEEEVEVNETFEDFVSVECPVCDCNNEYEVYSNRLDKCIMIECPACHGSGEIEASYYIELDDMIDVSVEETVRPYNEGYKHDGNSMTMNVNVSEIRKIRENVKNALLV